MANVKMYAGAIGGPIQTLFSGTVSPASDGTITVNSQDVPTLLAAGCVFLNSRHAAFTPPNAAAVAAAGFFFASAALANGTLAIAAQPEVMRPAQAVINPGTVALVGTLALTYTANDGTAQTDVFSLATPLSTNLTVVTTKGVEVMTSQVVTGVSGGVTPGIQIGTTTAISVPVDQGAVDFALTKEIHTGANATLGTLTTSLGSFTPSAAPNGTIVFGATYNYLAADI